MNDDPAIDEFPIMSMPSSPYPVPFVTVISNTLTSKVQPNASVAEKNGMYGILPPQDKNARFAIVTSLVNMKYNPVAPRHSIMLVFPLPSL